MFTNIYKYSQKNSIVNASMFSVLCSDKGDIVIVY